MSHSEYYSGFTATYPTKDCQRVLEIQRAHLARKAASDLVDRLLAIHPGLAVRALDAIESAVEVFEANRSKYPDMPGLRYPQSVHARHARDHLNRAMWPGAVSIDDCPKGDGLPDLAHAMARLLMAGRAEPTRETPADRPCSLLAVQGGSKPSCVDGTRYQPCGGLPAVYDAMTGERLRPCVPSDPLAGRMLSWKELLSVRIIP